ncbi:MAG: hypothetical protein F6K30_13965 [Cyanothece sp. SIO2G6]|nr:hypothetical protein [Cyanothece sp. SIO2G6]
MTHTITVEGKVFGRRRPVFTDWSVPLPPDTTEGSQPLTLRDLITCVVKAEVEAFRTRQAEQRLQRILSKADIEQGLAVGKVTMGDTLASQHNSGQMVDLEAAIDNALVGFIDGLYYVFLDEVQQDDLDATVHLQPDSWLTFLRLVALVGG